MPEGKQILKIRIDVPPEFVAAARWAMEHLLRPSNLNVEFVDALTGAADLEYSQQPSSNTMHIATDTQMIERMLAGDSINAADFARIEFEGIKLPVLTSSVSEGTLAGDIVSTAFYFLSGYDEYSSVPRDRHGRYVYADSIHSHLGCAEYPVVDYLRLYLWDKLRKAGWAVRGRENWFVCPTVDIDYTHKWRKGIIYRELVLYPVRNISGQAPGNRLKRMGRSVAQAVKNPGVYRKSLDHIIAGVERAGGRGTFFIKTGAREPYDVQYSLKGYLKKTIAYLRSSGHEVGLHPSYWAAENADMFREETERFADAVGDPPTVFRTHYLRWTNRTMDQLLAVDAVADSTLGFADHCGFRRGTCLPFLLFDFRTWAPVDLVELPLLVMDSSLFNRMDLTTADAVRATINILHHCRRVKGCAVLLWHNIILDELDCSGWAEHFEQIMDEVSGDADVVPLGTAATIRTSIGDATDDARS